MSSHFMAFGQKITLTNALEIQCDDKQIADIFRGIVESARESYRPAYGDPRSYVLAEITKLSAAHDVHNGFSVEAGADDMIY